MRRFCFVCWVSILAQDGSIVEGARVVRAQMLRAGVQPQDFFFYDGSGLSPEDRVTPRCHHYAVAICGGAALGCRISRYAAYRRRRWNAFGSIPACAITRACFRQDRNAGRSERSQRLRDCQRMEAQWYFPSCAMGICQMPRVLRGRSMQSLLPPPRRIRCDDEP